MYFIINYQSLLEYILVVKALWEQESQVSLLNLF
jgi:hypothetical protein